MNYRQTQRKQVTGKIALNNQIFQQPVNFSEANEAYQPAYRTFQYLFDLGAVKVEPQAQSFFITLIILQPQNQTHPKT